MTHDFKRLARHLPGNQRQHASHFGSINKTVGTEHLVVIVDSCKRFIVGNNPQLIIMNTLEIRYNKLLINRAVNNIIGFNKQ